MKFIIKHEIKGRMRFHLVQGKMSCREADQFLYYLNNLEQVTEAKVYERTADASVFYTGERKLLLEAISKFRYEDVDVPEAVMETSGRELNREYKEKLIQKVVLRVAGKMFLPYPVRTAFIAVRSLQYMWKGIRCLARRKIEVSVLDAVAIGVSVFRGDFNTASSTMFMLGIGEILEEWTHKKSVGDLARSMSLDISKVWIKVDGQEVLVKSDTVKTGDLVTVHMGNVVPFDGVVVEGEGMVNQASLTGEALPVRKEKDGYVYAGTVLEEGEITLEVKQVSGSTRFEKIVTMIEESEKLKSSMESRAERLADNLVPYTLAGTALTWLLTRNVTKALSVLMVDFSCALKLAMPITVLSAIREARNHQITVKGGKYLEAVAEADTIVFDKTGTLTISKPTVKMVVPFCDMDSNELLKIAACLEEHFPHSMAKAVVKAAQEKGLDHEEMHSKVDYIVAHGISSYIDEKKVIIGSAHFVFEDENCKIPEEYMETFDNLPEEYSHLYLAVEQRLAAVICIEDPLRSEARDVVSLLRNVGFTKIVMMTGDSERTAASVAAQVGVDEYYSEVLPEDKAKFIEREKASGKTVLMVGDGVNDSPALSAADVGIAVSDGAEIAREIADIMIAADNLYEIATLKQLSNGLVKRIRKNYFSVIGINLGLILMGITGIIMPSTSALLHNTSTLAISVKSMQNILPDEKRIK